MSYVAGLDLGQSGDPAALVIAERIEKATPRRPDVNPYPTQAQLEAAIGTAAGVNELHLRHIERIKLGTKYPVVVERVAKVLGMKPLAGRCELVVDGTGVGRPVVDMFESSGMSPISVSIHGGAGVTGEGRNWRVPKRDLVVGVQLLLQEGKLKIASILPEAQTLVSELLSFQVKINEVTAHDSYNARSGKHDDLVLSTALACWWAVRTGGKWFI